MDLWQYDATDLARLIRTGQASAREAEDSVLKRLHAVNPTINAVVRVLEPEARAAAETADAARTNAPAFSMRIFTDNALHGCTYSPRDRTVTPGGSSGGAGAATATGIGTIAHGNDIGGSVRIPAYCNGVVGLRTGFGRIPSINPSAPQGRPIGAVLMAVQGPHTRTVRDARLALEVMARGDR